MDRYLTKSRFKLALECPTKLFYTGKSLYPDSKQADPFLEALAEGGFQVGELAKLYYPEGHDIQTLVKKDAIYQTNTLLQQDHVVIFEGAFKVNNLFIRADIIVKNGNHIRLIEVKSKSFDGDDNEFIGVRSKTIKPGWLPYLFDVAFQKYVIQTSKPDYIVTAYLMLADKTKTASVDGLNQKFRLYKDTNGRSYCKTVGDTSLNALGQKLLVETNVDTIVDEIHKGIYKAPFQVNDFDKWVEELSSAFVNDTKIFNPIHKGCGTCQFRCNVNDEAKGLLSGFKECWKSNTSLVDSDFEEPLIFDLWKGALGGKDITSSLLEGNIFKLRDIAPSYYEPKTSKLCKHLSPTERRMLQINKVKSNDRTLWIDDAGLKEEMETWEYPLHFIDFETSAVAIPFNKGLRPYEGVAFQFSHHMVEKDGTVTHAGQYLNTNSGAFPNFEFIRALKKELEHDNGTIFRYADHENSYLNMIYRQLSASKESDAPELKKFIQSITKSSGDSTEKWEGSRNMVDMLLLVKNFYYHPSMKGSNSIKVVLPAALQSSPFLHQKYALPIYGKGKKIASLNFDEMAWIQYDQNGIINPYKLLPSIFDGLKGEELDKFITNEKLADGGAAMTAYAKMQFTDMSKVEHDAICQGLLKYCELDTLAMVMIYEHWKYDFQKKL